MKRFLQRLSLLLAVLLLLTTAVFADFGPKPQLVVRVEQPLNFLISASDAFFSTPSTS